MRCQMKAWPNEVFPIKWLGVWLNPLHYADLTSIILLLKALQQKSSTIKRSHFGSSSQIKHSKMRGFPIGKNKVLSKTSFTRIQQHYPVTSPTKSLSWHCEWCSQESWFCKSTVHHSCKGWPLSHDGCNLGVSHISKDDLYSLSCRWEMVATWFSHIQTESHLRVRMGLGIGWGKGCSR